MPVTRKSVSITALLSIAGCAWMLLNRHESVAQTGTETTVPSSVVAKVNQAELLLAELTAWTSALPESQRSSAQPAMLRTLIDRQLVLEYLAMRSLGATVSEIDLEMARWSKTLEERNTTPARFYEQTGWDAAAMRRKFAWSLGWPRYCEKQLTESRIAKYFAEHHRDFDGTQLRVAHILWKGSPEDLPQRREQAIRQGQAIRDGQISFSEAARTQSEAPTADTDGEIGWIERHHPMHPAFSDAAFLLQVDEISPPVVTPAGVHLIRCLEVRPGEHPLADVRQKVISAATLRLFRNVAARQRKSAQIEVLARHPE